MDDILSACSSELSCFFENDEDLMKLLYLIKKLNALPQVSKQSSEDSRCLYEAISNGLNIAVLEKTIEEFFFPLQKTAGMNVPVLLTFNKTVRMLRGIRKEQSFFMKKTGVGEIYGALWPWQSQPQNITILLGLTGDRIKDHSYQELEELIEQVCY
jgi:hypothetical protein